MNSTEIKESSENFGVHLTPWAELTLKIIGIVFLILVIIFLIRKLVQGPFYWKKNRIDGKVVIVTGCNTGIGKETVLELAKRGAKVYMACRDPVRCEEARLEIVEKSNNEKIFNRTLDLSSLQSVRKFANQFLQEEQRLDILINNAGIMATPKGYTEDGFEQQFGVNHLAHFLLTNLLLDTLKASAPSRIVVLTSAIYAVGRINKRDLMSEKSYSAFFGAYAQSKVANILFTKELSRKLDGTGVTVNCCHPGIVKTELSRHMIKKSKIIIGPLMRLFAKTPRAGAQTSLRLALDPGLEKVSGHYYFDCIRCPILPHARNPELAEYLWKKSEELIEAKSIKIVKTNENVEDKVAAVKEISTDTVGDVKENGTETVVHIKDNETETVSHIKSNGTETIGNVKSNGTEAVVNVTSNIQI